MAHIQKLDERRWQVRWREGKGRGARERTKLFPSKLKAQQNAAKIVDARADGLDFDPAKGRVSLRDFGERSYFR